jgi:glycosyltransferase involved in cell wall biosynthesis
VHILFLTDNFPPEVNAPASRTFEHCREWVRAGHKVTVITCAPNFPTGKVFPGYRNRLWQRETMEGIRVIRVWSYITANEGFVRRTLDYISYMVAALCASPFVRKPDLVVGTSPQFFTACAAYLVSRTKRIPFVFELRDLWPESIRAVGAMKNKAMLGRLERLELFLYRKAATVVSVTNSFKKNLIERSIDPQKIHVVTNGVDGSKFQPQEKDPELVARFDLQGKFVAGYIGTHGMAHALETVLEAAALAQAQNDGALQFLLLGNGAQKKRLREQAESMGLKNVLFLDSVPKEEVPRYWSLLDASIIHLKKTPLFTTVIPSKMFESMGMGIPLLHGVEGESAEIVESEETGLTFAPEQADQLLKAISTFRKDPVLYRQMQTNCLAAAKKYDRTNLAGRMLRILEAIAAGLPLGPSEQQETHNERDQCRGREAQLHENGPDHRGHEQIP